MKQKIVLLVVIAILLAAGYVAWDRSFREEITQQDIELAEKHLQSFNYGTKNLQVFNVYDKYDHAKFIYAQSDAGFALFYKNTGNFISAGQGGRYQGYLSEEYKLYLFPPFGYFVGPADMSFKDAKEQGLLHDIHQEAMDALNESSIYQRFLDGEALLERASVLPLQKYRKPYTLQELMKGWQDSLAEQTSYNPLAQTDPDINYALIDCMGDDEPELALRFCFSDGLSLFTEHCILKESNGVLQEVTNWNYLTEVNSYGFYKERSYYNDGKEVEIDGGVISTELGPYGGKRISIYQEIVIPGLSQPCIPMVYLFADPSDLPDGYPNDMDLLNADGPYTLHVYYLVSPEGDWSTQPFYAFSVVMNGEEPSVKVIGDFRKWYESAGIDLCSMEEAEERINACYEALGISPFHRNDSSISWRPL